jgi:hypothetical protein
MRKLLLGALLLLSTLGFAQENFTTTFCVVENQAPVKIEQTFIIKDSTITMIYSDKRYKEYYKKNGISDTIVFNVKLSNTSNIGESDIRYFTVVGNNSENKVRFTITRIKDCYERIVFDNIDTFTNKLTTMTFINKCIK